MHEIWCGAIIWKVLLFHRSLGSGDVIFQKQHIKPIPIFFARLQETAGGNIRMTTVAPEIEGVMPLIETLSGQGIIVALGHTAAGLELIRGPAQCKLYR